MGVQEKTQWLSVDEAQAFLQSECSVAKLVGEGSWEGVGNIRVFL